MEVLSRIIRVNPCCCCMSLETAGKIYGWLGVFFGIIGFLPSCLKLVTTIEFNGVWKIFSFFFSIWTMSIFIVSWMLINGIEDKSQKNIQPIRIHAFLGYVFVFSVLVNIHNSGNYSSAMKLFDLRMFGLEEDVLWELLISTLVIDFFLRFLVINSLYLKYKAGSADTKVATFIAEI